MPDAGGNRRGEQAPGDGNGVQRDFREAEWVSREPVRSARGGVLREKLLGAVDREGDRELQGIPDPSTWMMVRCRTPVVHPFSSPKTPPRPPLPPPLRPGSGRRCGGLEQGGSPGRRRAARGPDQAGGISSRTGGSLNCARPKTRRQRRGSGPGFPWRGHPHVAEAPLLLHVALALAAAGVGKRFSSSPTRKTAGNSSPLAQWSVISEAPPEPWVFSTSEMRAVRSRKVWIPSLPRGTRPRGDQLVQVSPGATPGRRGVLSRYSGSGSAR